MTVPNLVSITDLAWAKLDAIGRSDHQVLPVAVQDVDTGTVLMVAYVTQAALRESDRRGQAVFFSTSKGELHWKGETSGDFLELVDIRVNCEHNSLLMRVRMLGAGACHEHDPTGHPYTTCFHRTFEPITDVSE